MANKRVPTPVSAASEEVVQAVEGVLASVTADASAPTAGEGADEPAGQSDTALKSGLALDSAGHVVGWRHPSDGDGETGGAVIEARVLVDHGGYHANTIALLTEAEAQICGDWADTHPAAVAYAKSLGA
ncbi:hypothetical protein AEB_P2048 [Altererythrobacter sp. B11]|uniref:hypothetical protein n=1 Tax=Altererythrobacter sp. B11 TaxID=2060312 RepID=UPI000DC6D50C|nr:hypothetical protein [Altererythrobacter sp. B11]BBC72916.1 hypothetical protein AEB_P2048 [Altererythrobacter sp. B11]